MVFAGVRHRGGGRLDALHHDLIRMGSTAFWDAYLTGDEAAREWMAGGGFAEALGRAGTFESKLAGAVSRTHSGTTMAR